MDLQGLGALLTALGGVFSAKAGAKAGQLQGLLTGEDITERRKRMKMSEEAFELQKRLAEAEEARRQELFPLTKRGMEQQIQQSEEMFPLKREALATQVDLGKLQLEDTRLWTLFRQGVAPSQISDPVLRARYEPFFNYQMGVKSLEAVQTDEELDEVLKQVPEEFRPSLAILGRAQLFTNQSRRQMIELQMRGVETNIAQGEFNLRTTKLNYALNFILNNINSEGLDWDKRTPQQKIEAVKKWIAQLGLQDVVSEDFANMFQRIKSVDARQLALFRAQSEINYGFQSRLLGQQIAGNLSLLNHQMMGNLVFGAFGGQQQGGGVVAPLGFPATDMPPAPVVFNTTPDQQGNYLNQTALNNYLKAPLNIAVPIRVGNQIVPTQLSVLQAQAGVVYRNLARGTSNLTANDINTLIYYDAGLLQAQFAKNGMELDWNSALVWATQRVLPSLESHPAYQANPNFRQTLNNWKRAWEQDLQARQGATAPAPQGGGQNPAPNMPRGEIGGQRTPPPQSRGGGANYTSSARRRRE